jgi:hypothetical protein
VADGGTPDRSRASWADRRQAISARPDQNRAGGARHEASTRRITKREDTLLAKLVATRRRKRATGVKVDGRKSHAKARPEVVKRAQDLAQPKGQRGLSLRAISKALAAEGTSTSAESPSRRRASPQCWRRNVRRAADDERRDAIRRGGHRPHDRVRGADGNVGQLEKWLGLPRPLLPPAVGDRVSSPSNPTAARAGEKNSYSPGEALDLGSGAPVTGPIAGASHDRAEGGPSIFLHASGGYFTWRG